MNRVLTMLMAGAFALSLGACNRAEDPAEVQDDVAEAQEDASENVQEAQGDVMEAQEDTALARAEGEHEVAIERCEALPADQQEACKA
jgi:hypothetical protein